MKVLILNTCSTLNRGDAAIVLGQIQLLRRLFPGVEVALTSRTPALDRPFYEPLGVEVLAPFLPAASTFRGSRSGWLAGGRSLLARADRRRLVATMRQSDAVLSCGGGYLYSYRRLLPGTTFWQNVVHLALAARLHKPLIFMPQSFGPFANAAGRAAVKSLLCAAEVHKVLARERESYRLLAQMLGPAGHDRIGLCPDMALYLNRPLADQADAPSPTASPRPAARESTGQIEGETGRPPLLAMNLREWRFPGVGNAADRRSRRRAYLEAMEAVARSFVERVGGAIAVVPQALGPDPNEDDRGICREFYRQLCASLPAGSQVEYLDLSAASLEPVMALLSKASLLVGTRLHSCLLALLCGVPMVAIGYQPKSQGTLAMLGLERYHLSIDDLAAAELVGLLEEVMSRREDILAQVDGALARARVQIEDQAGSALLALLRGARG
ncbi:MAG: polysaccharide pyruvyl transferase family protein [Anaerolineae bacterium]|nr:polysaccharide pyruvyl transferase family protein [Anaerolineae bacterium]